MSRLFNASIVENTQVIQNHYLLTLHPSIQFKKPKPGTFFMVSVGNSLDPLLKRPVSMHRWLDGDFQLLYRVVGKGTDILSRKQPGDAIEVLGPLGNGFAPPGKQELPLLIAGGLGIAPIFGLADALCNSRSKNRKGNIPLLFYGARTKKEILCQDQLESLGIHPVIATDDGSFGKKGNIVTVLKNILIRDSTFKVQHKTQKNPLTRHVSHVTRHVLYACGPEPMLKAITDFAGSYNIKAFVSLEKHMACGVGTCLGCVVKTIKGYKRVCKEGPVFAAGEIVW